MSGSGSGSSADLSGIALPQLKQLLRLMESGDVIPPLTEVALQARGLGRYWPALAWLSGLDRAGLEAVLRVAIAERTDRPGPRFELVWTGPETKVSGARDTAVVVRELFSIAQRSVLVAGFSFTGGDELFRPLHTAMRDRGVEARIFLHLDDRPGCDAEESVRAGVQAFIRENWPFGDPLPLLYYDPRTVAPGSTINLHAKCVVVDEHLVLIGSANFTHNAMNRSIEAGIVVDDGALAAALGRQWLSLVHQGLLRQIALAPV